MAEVKDVAPEKYDDILTFFFFCNYQLGNDYVHCMFTNEKTKHEIY